MMSNMCRKICFFCLVVFCCLLIPVAGFSEEKVRHLTSITSGGEFGRLGVLGGLFYDEAKDRLYVTDASHNRILAFDSDFKFISEFTGGEALNWPTSLTRDSRGRFFVAQPSEGKVIVIDIAREDINPIDLSAIPSENRIYPCNLAIDSFDNLYVADKANRRILIFDINLEFSKEIPVKNGRGLKDVRVDSSGRVYTLSTIDGSVRIYSTGGKLLSKFGKRGTGSGEFRFPVSLAVDRKGLIYVLDQHMSKVLVFNKRGEFLFDFSHLGWREGRLHYPSYIFINRSERIFIIDRQNSRISIFE